MFSSQKKWHLSELPPPKEYGVEEVSWKPQFDEMRSVECDGYVGSIYCYIWFLLGSFQVLLLLFLFCKVFQLIVSRVHFRELILFQV